MAAVVLPGGRRCGTFLARGRPAARRARLALRVLGPGGAMRYNEKELQALSRQPAELAAELGMRGPKKGSVLKRRLVKLVVNFLFYFRTDEAEVGRPGGALERTGAGVPPEARPHPRLLLLFPQPVGALLLEHCRVTQEEPSGFSISFIEDPERKYHFECRSEEQCQEWMGALRRASYEFMRRSLIFYRNEIQKMTGKDPLEQFGISEEARFQLGGLKA
ncbi:pleckstrin homology domain-containing family J member 1 isoform X1 [Prionailurus bengalensis]|uniref:pleckstrin homology domain-containing family J member 1 isoform X1 n=1 Tax=Prionailurus bengalensis TaxID=37029 RepID=UPI001CA9FB41|nr:pleckstrin homology domain-containing family J member 1 isoform X1 [Prionailurus bengalensis]